MANKKSSKSKGDNPGSLLIALLVIASVLALFFYSSGVNMGNLFNTVRYHAADIGPRLVECVTSPESCKLNSNYNVTPSGYETNSTTNSNYNSKQPQQQNNTNDNNKAIDNKEKIDNNSSSSNTTEISNDTGIKVIPAANMSKEDSLNELNSIPIVNSYDKVKYKRTEWKHWIAQDKPCWSTREEVLDRQAEKGSIVYLDKNDSETKDKLKACSIKSGKWKDPYSNEIVTGPTKLDIDHTGALSWTAKAGGQNWTKQNKQDYANDFDHLVVTTAKENRTKGDKGPSEWLPKESKCEYSKIYTHIVKKYNLNLTQNDKAALENAINSCTA